MKLIITIPDTYPAERDYILSVILKEFLGLDYIIRRAGNADVCISDKEQKRCLVIPDGLFAIPKEKWLTKESLPKQPLEIWDPQAMGFGNSTVLTPVPIIYGARKRSVDEANCSQADEDFYLLIDIFGSAFFMLTRYEEIVKQDRDEHDRFPAWASLAFQESFLERPIIDEYVEILWLAMKSVWPRLKRNQRQSRTLVSCDVDQPYMQNVKSIGMTIRNMAGDLIKRKSIVGAVRTGLNTLCSSWGYYQLDPMNTFDWIMDVNEKAGNRVAFYFFADHSADEMGGCYSIQEPRIRELMRRIHARGHEIGLHSNYSAYLDGAQCEREVHKLRQAMEDEGIKQTEIGNRQHYLRWRTPETARNLEKAGINYDTTLGYADHPGFRCGTCLPYPMYDIAERKPLRLRQYPLVLMECTVIDIGYLGMGCTDAALDMMRSLKKRAHQLGGNFTLLWHNSRLETREARSMYLELIA